MLASTLAQISYFSFLKLTLFSKTHSAKGKGLLIKSSSFVAGAANADNQKLSLFWTQPIA